MAHNIFPRDIAEEAKACAEKASWYCARVRMGKKGEADAEKIAMEQHLRNFKKKLDGLLSGKTCDEINSMFWFAAWHTANTRVGYKSDAERDKKQMEDHYQNVIESGEVQVELATNLKWFGWHNAWLAANTMKGYKDDAVRDKANVDAIFQQISGEVKKTVPSSTTSSSTISTPPTKTPVDQTMMSPVDDSVLSGSDDILIAVLRSIIEVTDWFTLGLTLRLPSHDMERIKRDGYDERERQRKMVSLWLNKGKASWKELVQALIDPLVNKEEVAKKIAEQHPLKH